MTRNGLEQDASGLVARARHRVKCARARRAGTFALPILDSRCSQLRQNSRDPFALAIFRRAIEQNFAAFFQNIHAAFICLNGG
jgi:hypothetical protein